MGGKDEKEKMIERHAGNELDRLERKDVGPYGEDAETKKKISEVDGTTRLS